jgi:hypothetical protein
MNLYGAEEFSCEVEDDRVDEAEECEESPVEGSSHERDTQDDCCVYCGKELRP